MGAFIKKITIVASLLSIIILGFLFAFLLHDPSWKNETEYLTSAQQFNFKEYGLGDVWLISYANVNPIYMANQNILHKAAIDYEFKFHKLYRTNNIDPQYFTKHQHILSQKRGAGYWLWKPYFILKTLETIPENDVVVYLDGGSYIINSLNPLIFALKDYDILLFENNHTHRTKTKRYLLQLMGKDHEQARDSLQMQASFIFIKNTAFARDFVRKWLIICEDENALTDTRSNDEYPEFQDHRHDQSILSLLYLDHQNNITTRSFAEVKKYFYHHRKRSIRKYRPQELYVKIKAWLYKA